SRSAWADGCSPGGTPERENVHVNASRLPDLGRLSPLPGVQMSTIAAARARELVFCLAGMGLGLGVPALLISVLSVLAAVADARPRPAAALPVLIGGQVILLLVLVLAPRIGRWLGGAHRRVAARLLGVE